jgi:hypothetical protein
MDQNRLLVPNGARDTLDRAIEVGESCRLVEMIEARPEVSLGVIRLAESANGEEATHRVRQAELFLELRDDRRIRLLRQQPPAAGTDRGTAWRRRGDRGNLGSAHDKQTR